MTNIELYKFAYNFLLSKKGVTDKLIRYHFKPQYQKPKNLNDLFQRLCETSQNKQMSSKVIGGSIGGVKNLKNILYNFNPRKVADNYSKTDSDKLLKRIVSVLKPSGQIRQSSRSI